MRDWPAVGAEELASPAPVAPVTEAEPATWADGAAFAGPMTEPQWLDDDRVSPVRALAGAAVAVAGVLLGIGALLWSTDSSRGTPALQEPVAARGALPSASSAGQPLATAAAAPSGPVAPVAPPLAASPAASAPQAARPAPPPAALPPLTVLNNSDREGLARRMAARFDRDGWEIRQVGNFNGRLRTTTVYYDPGQREAAQRLARSYRGIERVLPRSDFPTLPGRGLTVVLTRDFPA
ncbi:MAG TPA: LytR C-terminal domain-containing protein [Mycobacteriales bacterium]|nr:LytR C-terminal domain-containing protein [Mycobacteriales bacterium]